MTRRRNALVEEERDVLDIFIGVADLDLAELQFLVRLVLQALELRVDLVAVAVEQDKADAWDADGVDQYHEQRVGHVKPGVLGRVATNGVVGEQDLYRPGRAVRIDGLEEVAVKVAEHARRDARKDDLRGSSDDAVPRCASRSDVQFDVRPGYHVSQQQAPPKRADLDALFCLGGRGLRIGSVDRLTYGRGDFSRVSPRRASRI